MLGLPTSTEMKKQLPKTLFSQKMGLKSEDKRLIDENVKRLDLVNQLSLQTIPAIAIGVKVKTIYILKATLKKKNYSLKALSLILKMIPQKVVLVITYEGESQLAVFDEQIIFSEWQDDSYWTELAPLVINGADLDAVWISLKMQIRGIVLSSDKDLTEEVFAEECRQMKALEDIRRRLTKLKERCYREIQPRKRFALHCEVRSLEKKIKEIENVNS